MEENLFRGIINRVLHLMARFGPGATSLRPLLHRLRGVKIHGKVFIMAMGSALELGQTNRTCVQFGVGPRQRSELIRKSIKMGLQNVLKRSILMAK